MFHSGYVTDFADQAVVLPLAMGTGLFFALSGWRRGVLVWTVTIGGTLGLMLVLKLCFLACGHLLPEARLHSPSGHASAAAIYGGVTGALIRSRWGGRNWVLPTAVGITIFFALIFGITRLELRVHSLPEVIVGGAVGALGASAFIVFAGAPAPRLRTAQFVAPALLLILLLHGLHLPVEVAIHSAARQIWPLSLCYRTAALEPQLQRSARGPF